MMCHWEWCLGPVPGVCATRPHGGANPAPYLCTELSKIKRHGPRVWAQQNCAVSKGKDAMMKLRTAHCFDRTCLEQQGAVTNGKDATVKLSGACAATQRLAGGPLSSPGVALVLISGILAAKRQRPYSPTDAFLASRPATAADRSPLLRTAFG